MQETWVRSLGLEDPLEKGTTTHSKVFWPGEFWVAKYWTQLSNFHFHFSCFIIMLKKRTNANEMMIIYFFKFRKAFEVISPLHFWELP